MRKLMLLGIVTTLVIAPPSLVAPAAPTTKCGGERATIIGTRGGDALFGTEGRDVVVLRGGSDWFRDPGGNDLICPGNGSDRVYAGPGADTILSRPDTREDDLIRLGRGADTMRGSSVYVHGAAGRDLLDAADVPTRVQMLGGPGNDVLLAGSGSRNVLIGNAGADYLANHGGSDADIDAVDRRATDVIFTRGLGAVCTVDPGDRVDGRYCEIYVALGSQ